MHKSPKRFVLEEPYEDANQQQLREELGKLIPIRQRKVERAQTELAQAKQRLKTQQAALVIAEEAIVSQRAKCGEEIALLSKQYLDKPLDQEHLKQWQMQEEQILRKVYRKQEEANSIKASIQTLQQDLLTLADAKQLAEKKQQKLSYMLTAMQ